jgi:hypothetical protein
MKTTDVTQRMGRALACSFVAFAFSTRAADIPKAPVPPSPYLPMVYRYADAMIERGRNSGPQKSELFFSVMDRATLTPFTNYPPAPQGIRESDRAGATNSPVIGANLEHDENLLRLLYTLSELSGKPKYRDAANAELKWFTQHGKPTFFRPWLLWDRCFDLAPEASKQLANGMSKGSNDAPREAGFKIRTWAVAYGRTRDEQFPRAIEQLLSRYGSDTALSSGGAAAVLSLGIDCDGAAHRVSAELASRLRATANRADEVFRARESFTPLWNARHGPTTAQIGMMCVSRYDNTGTVEFRELVHAAANSYLKSMPSENEDVWPLTIGQAISLQLAAWRSTAQPQYLARARVFADFAVQKFFDGSPLPRASLKTEHYETITGADTLALALVELHLQILHITAVRCPPNTIDR